MIQPVVLSHPSGIKQESRVGQSKQSCWDQDESRENESWMEAERGRERERDGVGDGMREWGQGHSRRKQSISLTHTLRGILCLQATLFSSSSSIKCVCLSQWGMCCKMQTKMFMFAFAFQDPSRPGSDRRLQKSPNCQSAQITQQSFLYLYALMLYADYTNEHRQGSQRSVTKRRWMTSCDISHHYSPKLTWEVTTHARECIREEKSHKESLIC